MSDEEELFEERRKTTTIVKSGLSVELSRNVKGQYRWLIKVDIPSLNEEELLRRLERVDRELRKRFLKEEVEERGEEVVKEEEPIIKTIPLKRKRGKLLGRILVFENKVGIEPLNSLPIKDAAISWLVGYLEGRFGKDRVDLEKTSSLERFKRIIVQGKISDQDLKQIRRKAAWSFEKAMEREEAEKQ